MAGNILYLHATSSEDVKAKCVKEKRNWFYENQYIDCLARNGRPQQRENRKSFDPNHRLWPIRETIQQHIAASSPAIA